ncbi:YjfJ protein [Colletotrichum higginsianum IMI 349063]|uniref:YjfJ protein n=1 Tax=Colletotrichum higginsianum (strain IMI 349063) TaxID=759273 RepID=A0A1B7XY29_COLHI|nr:YjfJ protein [Colletotrichum higginsianum IMI 349063]OBR04641.1 YjfJ protein [Colletotrichum higginsianum IMI 349063]GJC99278.1 yjfJ protein [Colletotrichum higginsianum]
MSFMGRKSDAKSEDVAHVPPELSDLHCFTETGGVITTRNIFGQIDAHTPAAMFDIPGYRVVRTLGAVYGLSVRSRNIAASLGMVIKSLAGGELRWFTTMLYNCRNDALGRVVSECKQRGGNAIICLRFDAADLGGFAQTCAYGTACVVEKIDEDAAVAPQLAS